VPEVLVRPVRLRRDKDVVSPRRPVLASLAQAFMADPAKVRAQRAVTRTGLDQFAPNHARVVATSRLAPTRCGPPCRRAARAARVGPDRGARPTGASVGGAA